MRSHRNLHHLLGIENMETMPHHMLGHGIHHFHHHIMPMGEGLTAGGGGLYATPHGGHLSKIGQAFNKAFNPQKNGVAHAVQHDLITPAVKVGDQIKTGVVKTYNQAKSGFNNTFTPTVGKDIVSDLKTVGRYAIPAVTSATGALLGGLATGGLGGQLVGSTAGAYAGYKADQALGLTGHNDFVGVKGKGLKKHKKVKGGTIKKELEKVWDKVPEGFHQPLEDLGRAGIEYAGYHIPPKKGKGIKGSKSKTRKGDMDYTTKKGDKYYHRGGHEETSNESDTDSDTDSEDGTSFDGGSVRRRKPRGMGMKKGSPQMKAHMAKLRAMKGKGKVSGTGIHGIGQVDNNSPHSGAVRLSPYQNF